MICNNCGSEIADTAAFCTVCGAPVSGSESQPQPQPEPQPQPQPQMQQSNQQQDQQSYYQPSPYSQGYNGYQQPYNPTFVFNQQNLEYHPDEHVSVGGWIGRSILTFIPIVGLVMLFVWSFGSSKKHSLQTWARAQLLIMLIGTILSVAIYFIMAALGVGLVSYMN